jgi:ZIP family zinc transporter
MLNLTVTDLLPEAEERHYQQSAALALAAGFMTIFALGQLF